MSIELEIMMNFFEKKGMRFVNEDGTPVRRCEVCQHNVADVCREAESKSYSRYVEKNHKCEHFVKRSTDD